MDYLDPRKRRRHTILLYLGYVLIGIAIIIATIVLLYQANGFGFNKKGTVIQNGLVFISSQPRPALIYIDGRLQNPKTNTRVALPEATYNLRLQRSGYLDWQRKITVEGGRVQHYDYPFLIPKTLTTAKLLTYEQTPTIFSQSPDKRYLLVGQPSNFTSFDVFDLKNPAKAPTAVSLPATLLASAKTSQSWQALEWADDSQHLLLQHHFDNSSEYILLDRETPDQSLNLSQTLNTKISRITLVDRKYDHFYIYDSQSSTLSQATLKNPTATAVLSGIISYQSYGTDSLLYATAVGASAGKVRIELKAGDKTYTIRSVAANTNYLLDITKYNDIFYAVVGASSENKVYLYRDPVGQIGSDVFKSPAPTQLLHVDQPNFVGFSSTAQYVVAENGTQFGVYDIENKRGYSYTAQQVVDGPQLHASWMDGNRLTYVSSGQQVIFDYDYQNVHKLGKANPSFMPIFAPDYKYSYTIAPGSAAQATLAQTGLLIPSEL